MIQNTQLQGKRIDEETWKNLIYLSACAVNGKIPEIQKVKSSTDKLFSAARRHMLAATVGMALEEAGIRNEIFDQAIAAAQRKNALLDADRARVLASLEKAGIWYMPLKGVLLKDLYPRYGMREMVDNDILIDPEHRNDVRRIMEDLGFVTKLYEDNNHDVYHKKPVSSFEMHVYLVNGRSNDALLTYYLNIKDRLLKDKENQYGYHFSDNDFYLFLMAHEYKHYVEGGTGLRSLLDIYVYLKQKQKNLDWNYIQMEIQKMDIANFEKVNKALAMHLFEGENLSTSEEEMLEYIISSGAYGTIENDTANQINKAGGRLKFALSRITLTHEEMLNEYPVLQKAPWLYPVMWVWRFIRMFFINHKYFMYQLKAALGIVTPPKGKPSDH